MLGMAGPGHGPLARYGLEQGELEEAASPPANGQETHNQPAPRLGNQGWGRGQFALRMRYESGLRDMNERQCRDAGMRGSVDVVVNIAKRRLRRAEEEVENQWT